MDQIHNGNNSQLVHEIVLTGMSKEFDGLYSEVGRPSIAPERLLRALLEALVDELRSLLIFIQLGILPSTGLKPEPR